MIEKKKYNGDKVIPLFHVFIKYCSRHQGTKYSFFKLIKSYAVKSTIYMFLDTLETYGALEKVNVRGEEFFRVNEKNLKKAYLSYDVGQMSFEIVDSFSKVLIE